VSIDACSLQAVADDVGDVLVAIAPVAIGALRARSRERPRRSGRSGSVSASAEPSAGRQRFSRAPIAPATVIAPVSCRHVEPMAGVHAREPCGRTLKTPTTLSSRFCRNVCFIPEPHSVVRRRPPAEAGVNALTLLCQNVICWRISIASARCSLRRPLPVSIS
jgi:hypothetical protein